MTPRIIRALDAVMAKLEFGQHLLLGEALFIKLSLKLLSKGIFNPWWWRIDKAIFQVVLDFLHHVFKAVDPHFDVEVDGFLTNNDFPEQLRFPRGDRCLAFGIQSIKRFFGIKAIVLVVYHIHANTAKGKPVLVFEIKLIVSGKAFGVLFLLLHVLTIDSDMICFDFVTIYAAFFAKLCWKRTAPLPLCTFENNGSRRKQAHDSE